VFAQQCRLVFSGDAIFGRLGQYQVAPLNVAGLEHVSNGRIGHPKEVQDVRLTVAVGRI